MSTTPQQVGGWGWRTVVRPHLLQGLEFAISRTNTWQGWDVVTGLNPAGVIIEEAPEGTIPQTLQIPEDIARSLFEGLRGYFEDKQTEDLHAGTLKESLDVERSRFNSVVSVLLTSVAGVPQQAMSQPQPAPAHEFVEEASQ